MGKPTFDPYDHNFLRHQIKWQSDHHFDLDNDIDWKSGINREAFFLPVDMDAIAFPGATEAQRRTLSQLMGLIVNSTISEMEVVANKLKNVAWRRILSEYPVNPEMITLGEMFFDEEAKHAKLFQNYLDVFMKQEGIDPQDLDVILPKAFGSTFQSAIRKNAQWGGHAFWWVVAMVEEVSVLIFQQLFRHRKNIDPLFYQIHRKHFEEESKHTHYAFMMLEVINDKCQGPKRSFFKKTDLMFSEIFSTVWVMSELHKIFQVEKLRGKHPFFDELADCLPLMRQLSWPELVKKLFVSAPYVSLILNKNYHHLSLQSAKDHRALHLRYPKPKLADTVVSLEKLWKAS